MTLILDLFPSLGDVVAALTIATTLSVIYLEKRRQDAEHYEELARRARGPRHDRDDAHFEIR